ncbi:MAG: DUF1971 domain-containing protein [Microthrixaceae bacterium]
MDDELPPGLEYVRTTEEFDQDHHPAGLRRAHRVADRVWGRLLVRSGSVDFVFEDDPRHPIHLTAPGSVVIPPGRLHHVDLPGPATFAVEFHREPDRSSPDRGEESTGLAEE